ncbi:MAG TPA: histidine phosphatase family protein [Candidatus Binatia bacterium]|nr:histidine phosphatase family protein [Candidatus Binatia bacterium]
MERDSQKIYLVRHGETEWSRAGKHTGVTDVELTERGRETARSLKSVLARESFVSVLSSPLHRARETCRLAGLQESAAVETDLMEWNYGVYDGLTTKEIQSLRPGWSVFHHGCPGGETPEQVTARADRVVAKVRASNGNVALFAHGHILRVFAARWINLPPSFGEHLLLDTATVCVLGYYYDTPALKIWNAPIAR